MKAKIEDGEIRLDVLELVGHLDAASKKQLAQYLCFDEYLLKAVAECVATGEMFADDESAPWWFDRRTVNGIREKLLPLMDEVARRAVKEALRQRNQADAEKARHSRWAWKMYHAWPDGFWRARPEIEQFQIVEEEAKP